MAICKQTSVLPACSKRIKPTAIRARKSGEFLSLEGTGLSLQRSPAPIHRYFPSHLIQAPRRPMENASGSVFIGASADSHNEPSSVGTGPSATDIGTWVIGLSVEPGGLACWSLCSSPGTKKTDISAACRNHHDSRFQNSLLLLSFIHAI